MTMLFLQTLLMMLAAYFVGAAIACGLRKLIAPARRTAVRVETPRRAVEPLPQAARATASDTVSRFEKALGSVEPPRPAPTPVVAPPPPRIQQPVAPLAPVVTAAPVVAPAAVVAPVIAPPVVTAPVVSRPAAAHVEIPHPAPPTELVVPPPPRISLTMPPVETPSTPVVSAEMGSAAKVAAAAAAATAAAVTARVVAAVAPAASVPVAPNLTPVPAPVLEPAPIAQRAPSASAAPAATVLTDDDLTRIRGIDKPIADSLKAMGITRYAQIAGWMRPDVTRVNQGLGFKQRVERENWIEQAQILANRGETLYARRLTRPTATTLQAVSPVSTPTHPPAAIVAATAPPTAQDAPTVRPYASSSMPGGMGAGGMGLAAAAAAAAAAAGTRTAAALPSRDIPPPAPQKPHVEERAAFAFVRKTEATTAAAVAAVAPPASPTIARPPEATPPAVTAAPAVTYHPPVPPAQALRPAMAPSRDELQRISGINAEVEKLLNVQGVTRYGQIAGWGQPEIDRFDRLLGAPGRVRRESWIEQSQMLMKGGETSGARAAPVVSTGTVTPATAMSAVTAAAAAAAAAASAAARPARLTDAIQAQQMQPPVASTVPAPGPAHGPITPPPSSRVEPGRGDLSALRSVKSEAFHPGAAARGGALDDLKRIRGIGVLIEKRLNALGVTGYEQIAHWTADDIAHYSRQLDFKGRIERENWVEQARILASGGFTEFSRRVDRGEVETSKPRV